MRARARTAAALAAALAAACIPEEGPLMSPGENCLECHGGGLLEGEAPTVADPEGARRWTIAGTVFPSIGAAPGDGVRGAKVHVRDANGRTFTLETNRAGNFYSAERVRFPLRVGVEYQGVLHEMEPDVPYGGCNGCHRQPPRRDAPGRISVGGDAEDEEIEGPLMRPGQNCLECHGGTPLPGEPPTVLAPREAPRWTIAGTVFPSPGASAVEGVAGALIHVVDANGQTLTLETNQAGNFYTAVALQFPLRVRLEYAGLSFEMEPDVPYGGCNGCHRLPPRQDAPGRISVTGADDD